MLARSPRLRRLARSAATARTLRGVTAARCNDVTLEYEVDGSPDGEPLLLVMGLGAQLTDWPQGFVDLLVGEGFRVIRFDNRDAGLSSGFDWEPPSMTKVAAMMVARRRPRAGYLLRDMALDAVALLDALSIDRAHVAGVSMGGMIAQTMAIWHPTRVSSLTSIMSSTGDGRNGRPSRRVLAQAPRFPQPTRENAVDRAVEMYRLIGGAEQQIDEYREMAAASVARAFRPEGVGRQLAAIMASPDRTLELSGVTAPTLVVHGLADPLVTPSGGIATAKAVPGSRLVMFPEMGHDLPRERWPEIVAAVRANAEQAR